MIGRRTLLAGSASLAAVTALPRRVLASHAGRTVGCIRYDALYNSSDPGDIAELSIPAYQYRAPACATLPNSYTVNVSSCLTQAQIDSEITVAHTAGLDYFVFFWWNTNNTASFSYNYFQSSSIKSLMNWCVNYGSYGFFISDMTLYSASTPMANLMKQSNYQLVLTSRPLLYLLSDGTAASTLATAITTLRAACSSAGAGNPYIVLMGSSTPADLTASGADALGDYAITIQQGTYPALVTAVEAAWNTKAALGSSMVPLAMTGWDIRPRLESPFQSSVSSTSQRPFVGLNNYVSAGTTAQIAAHVGDMLTWLSAHSAAAPAQTGLIYSWSENSEGGSVLMPTLGQGSAILTAVGGAL